MKKIWSESENQVLGSYLTVYETLLWDAFNHSLGKLQSLFDCKAVGINGGRGGEMMNAAVEESRV